MGYVVRRIDPLTQDALDELGRVLRRLRAERGISQAVLGIRSGVHQSTISRLECGRAPWFKVLTLASILAGLERSEEEAEAVRMTPETPGWRQLMAVFSTRGDFAARIKARRAEARLRVQERMRPHASQGKYEGRRRAQRGNQRARGSACGRPGRPAG